MSILRLLQADGSITVNRYVAQQVGLHESIILYELIRWYIYYADRGELDADGMFYCTVDKMQENTTLSKHQQGKAIGILQQYGMVESKQKGLPAKRYFKINEEHVFNMVANKKLKKLTTDDSAEKCTSKPIKPRHDQKLKNSLTRDSIIDEQQVKKLTRSNLELNNLKSINKDDDDDDRAAVPLVDINHYYSIYKFDSKTDFQKAFDEVKARVDVEYAKGTIGSYADYFERSFAKEVTKYEIRKGKKQAAATKALELKRSLRGKGVSNKPNLLIVGQQKEGDLQVEINDQEFDENYLNELIEAAERRNKERRDVERWQRTE